MSAFPFSFFYGCCSSTVEVNTCISKANLELRIGKREIWQIETHPSINMHYSKKKNTIRRWIRKVSLKLISSIMYV